MSYNYNICYIITKQLLFEYRKKALITNSLRYFMSMTIDQHKSSPFDSLVDTTKSLESDLGRICIQRYYLVSQSLNAPMQNEFD